MIPLRIDWFLTRICDQAKFCRFCYAPWNFFPADVTTSRALQICDRLQEIGTESVTLCGGEPFMYPGLEAVVGKLHELRIRIVLYTSGTSDIHDVRTFLPLVEFLSLPVDAVSPDAVSNMRGVSQFRRVSTILDMLTKVSDRPKIKIGTVVTKQNIKDIPRIGDFLRSLDIIDVWRLYEFSPYGIGKHNEENYLLDDGIFQSAVEAEKRRNDAQPGTRLLIAERSRIENEGYCMIMDSGGSLYRYEEQYIPLGITIEDDPSQIIAGYNRERHVSQKAWHDTTAKHPTVD